MKILQAASEVFPYSKTGGLADTVAGLAKALAAGGTTVDVVTPLYRGIRERFPEMADWGSLEIPLDWRIRTATIWRLEVRPNLAMYFVDEPGYFDRDGIYNEHGTDFSDNAERYIFFSKAVTALAERLNPDVVHLHDWQTGLVPAMIQQRAGGGLWEKAPKTCFSVHNLVYQGVFPYSDFRKTGLPDHCFHFARLEYFGQMNCLKGGIALADWVSTVSPTYAQEITEPEFGASLDDVLRNRGERLTGILNGVDYEEWKTRGNPHVKHGYDLENLRGKGFQKRGLQKEMGLPQDAKIPLFGTVTRLDPNQKGIDILLDAVRSNLDRGLQFVLLGSGDKHYEASFSELAGEYPDQVSVRIGYDHALAHRIEAGCDFFLMPSRYEPCGLNQLYSLRYGTLPIVRAVGGLEDTVIDLEQDPDRANGFKFREYSAEALGKCIRQALVFFENPELMKRLRVAGMSADHSWDRVAAEYLALYGRIMEV